MLSHPPVNAPDEELHNVSRWLEEVGARTALGCEAQSNGQNLMTTTSRKMSNAQSLCRVPDTTKDSALARSRVAGQRTQIGSFGCANPCVRSLELIERPRQLVAVGQMRCLKARDMPIGTMTTRAIVPRTVSIVSLAWKALRRQCRRATALVSVQGCQREVHSSAISTKIHIRVAVTIYLPGRSNTAGRNKWSQECP